MTNEQRIKNYKEDILSLKHILKTTSPKDDDIKAEIREEIADIEKWITRLSLNLKSPERG